MGTSPTGNINKMSFVDITPGDIIGDLHGHQITEGKFHDWEFYNQFKITLEMFTDIFLKLDVGKPVSNKTGYIVRATEDMFGNASQLMIIYQYNSNYYCAFMIAPQWKKII